MARRQVRQLDAALDQSARAGDELDLLRDIARSLLAHHALDEVLDIVARGATSLLGATDGYIVLVEEGSGTLRLAAATGALRARAGEALPSDGSMAGWVIERGEPLLVDDLASDQRAWVSVNVDLGLERGATVPLVRLGRVVGALGCDNAKGGRPFRPRDLDLLDRLGEQAVLAIESARLFERAEAAREALEKQNVALEQAVRLKTAFLTNMSHELRTPLNAIIGFGELLAGGALGEINDDQKDGVDTVVRNSRHLLGLINDLLDISKVEAGKMQLHLTPVDLRVVVAGVLRDLGGLVAQRRQQVISELGEEPLTVVADEVRVRQVLFNLISNAAKFTPEGGEISVRGLSTRAPLPLPAERSGDECRLTSRAAAWVAVGDTGPGIKPEEMGLLFQEFSQVDGSASRRHDGTGLGLALCKRFVELHGGTIGAESVYGHGSTFWFLLPVDGPIRRNPPPPIILEAVPEVAAAPDGRGPW